MTLAVGGALNTNSLTKGNNLGDCLIASLFKLCIFLLQSPSGAMREVTQGVRIQSHLMNVCLSFRCNERSNPGCENPITLDECVSIFRVLQSEYYTEYKMYDLESLAIALVFPLVSVMVYFRNQFSECSWNREYFRSLAK